MMPLLVKSCPKCHGGLTPDEDVFRCVNCGIRLYDRRPNPELVRWAKGDRAGIQVKTDARRGYDRRVHPE